MMKGGLLRILLLVLLIAVCQLLAPVEAEGTPSDGCVAIIKDVFTAVSEGGGEPAIDYSTVERLTECTEELSVVTESSDNPSATQLSYLSYVSGYKAGQCAPLVGASGVPYILGFYRNGGLDDTNIGVWLGPSGAELTLMFYPGLPGYIKAYLSYFVMLPFCL